MKIIAVLAMDESLLIGKSNGLPWHIPEDMKHFNALTKGGIVVMGRKTYLSLPEKYRPLPDRRNIVISRDGVDGIESYPSIELFLQKMKSETIEKVMLIGGASLYNQFFEKGIVDEVELTLIDGTHEGDIYVKDFRQDFTEINRQDFSKGKFITYKKGLCI